MKNNLIGISGKIGSGKDTVGNILRLIAMAKAHPGLWNIDDIAKDVKMLEHNVTKIKSDYDLNCRVTRELLDDGFYQIKKYADKLKDIVCLLIGCTREQLEDREFKEKELGKEWDKYIFGKNLVSKSEIIQAYEDEWGSKPSNYWLDSQKITMTPRKLLQLLGTDCGRQIIHPNIWVNALFTDYQSAGEKCGFTSYSIRDIKEGFKDKPNWIITDVRFPNEVEAIKKRGGKIIRVVRPMNLKFPKLWKMYTSSNRFINTTGQFLVWLLGHNEEMWDKLNHPSETALDSHKFDITIDNNGSLEDLIEKIKQLNLV